MSDNKVPLLPASDFFSEVERSTHLEDFQKLCSILAAEGITLDRVNFPHPYSYAVADVLRRMREAAGLATVVNGQVLEKASDSLVVVPEPGVSTFLETDGGASWQVLDESDTHINILDEEGAYRARITSEGHIELHDYITPYRERPNGEWRPGDQSYVIKDVEELDEVMCEICSIAARKFPDAFEE